ncbi:aldehyde dehydrogenase family protein [Saccharopolyspora sp. HNM0986]|uniref:aldehyde dehydrogenase family protein n=1 Tax=Saccharopolyspora galaxeae TaxID=2781241 RepID=UPI00190D7B52|nr:aldehyde dehydrogenase family protein [Saccharopolyspora sp. HNM0986]MBK0868179.1 aldehyde dehydrogenase family protein [Saccharopolyspora sp. HNM0986]
MATPTAVRTEHVIDGAYVAGSGERIDVVDPATEQVVGSVPAGTAADVDAAVAAARAAFDGWAARPVAERSALVRAISEGIARRRDEIAATVTAEMGSPIGFATQVHASVPVATSAGIADVLDQGFDWTEEHGNSLIVREPVGVVGAITPWNYPLHQIVAKVAAALAAGCTVVLKPSELAPLTASIFAEIAAEAGVPAGVFNLLHGTGPVVGEAIAGHPDVDMVSFTGSTRAGRRVSEVAAGTVKRVALELGGKSANVVLDDADLAKAVKLGVAGCFPNGGQSCNALSRMLVPESRHDEAVELAVAAVAKYSVGDPSDERTRIGPMASDVQRDRVVDYIRSGVAEGASVVTGGPEAPDGLDRGYYVRPTVFTGVSPDMTIAREEIFGPVLSILPYRDDDEAVAIANDSEYGLSGAVFGSDERALAVARRIRTGQVAVNGGAFNPNAPFGGYKQSGNGREFGKFGLEEFLEVKSIQR